MSISSVTIKSKFKTIVTTGILLLFVYAWYFDYFEDPDFVYIHKNTHAPCIIPEINPFDKEIMKHYWRPNPIVCSKETELVYIDNKGYIHVNHSRVNTESLKCNYQPIKRKVENDNEVDYGYPVWFNDTMQLQSDFIKVQCFDGNSILYDRLHYNIHKVTKKDIKSDQNHLSVLIFSIDSMSRLAAIRELPKTIQYLTETLNAYILKGYTIVGGNSFPNMISFLAGRQAYSKEFPVKKDVYFDNYPFIWNNFSKLGAVTMYAEDYPRLSTLNYEVAGFNNSPVDHYLRPFYLGINQIGKYYAKINKAFLTLEDMNIRLGKTSSLCYGDERKHVIQINYFKRFLRTYRDKFKFALSWLNELSHDFVNFIKLADDDILDFLKFLKNDGHLENSVLFFISDHGSRVDTIRNTPIGRLEVRLPFFSMVLPESLKQKYPHLDKHLKENINRLTSGFDFHETIKDILTNKFVERKINIKRPFPRGLSLFQEIPIDRTCADATIGGDKCACYTYQNVSLDYSVVKSMAVFAVVEINKWLQNYKADCAQLFLKTIKEAKQYRTQLKMSRSDNRNSLLNYFVKPTYDETLRYFIVFDVKPSLGLFEATIEKTREKQFTVLGDILRTNRYGNQSDCIKDRQLKPYCYCV